ncbi:MAG: S8 family serine peptidase [Kiritimatiellia bacterium]
MVGACLLLMGIGSWVATCAHPRGCEVAARVAHASLAGPAAFSCVPQTAPPPSVATPSATHALRSGVAPLTNTPASLALSEELLAPLRREFTPPRFAERHDVPPERQTFLANRLLISVETRSIPTAASGQQSASPRNTTPFVIQLNTPVGEDSRQLLKALGATVRGYFPNNALLAELTPAALAGLQNVPAVQAVEEFRPSDKLQPFLAALLDSQPPTARIRTTIQTFAPEDAAAVADTVRAVGGEVERCTAGASWGTVQAILPLSAIRPLVNRGEIQWVEEHVQLALRNDKAAIGTHLNTTNLWNRWTLTGKGQIVAHADTGLDTGSLTTMHPDFQGRILALIARGRFNDASDPDGHGTHTAGSILGSGAASGGQYRGMAYEASLVHQSVMDAYGYLNGIGDIYDLFTESYGYGACIHSDSWGSDSAGAYDSNCRSVDLFAWDHPDHLAVFASGNAGEDANRNGVVDLGSVGTPASAKNALSVGAAENDRPAGSGGATSYTWGTAWPSSYPTAPITGDYLSYSASVSPYRQGMAAFSSRGPTQDGRIKPDLVAPGTDVISTKSSISSSSGWGLLSGNTRYMFNGGTSMATPLIAGCAALVRQYAVERGGITNPSAALIKAMLVGGARSLAPGQYGTGAYQEIPSVSPNNVEGWGEADIEGTVHPTNRMMRLYDRIAQATGTTNTFPITVTISNRPLDIALVWMDYPATAGAGLTRVNDLDLRVIAPDGSTLFPNGGGSRDSLNTVESVRLPTAQAGVYQVLVIGYAVPYAGGAAALYVRGAIDAPPVIVNAPITNQLSSAPSYPATFRIQNLTPLTNGEVSLYWTTGNASAATGAWQTITATWTGGAGYQATIPAQPADTYIHYYLQALTGSYDVRMPANAPSTTESFYIGDPIALIVSGAPAPYGTVTPAYGTNTVIGNVPGMASASAPVVLSNGVRRTCIGWSGTGDIPASGTSNTFTFTIHQPSSLTWQWQEQFALTNRYRQVDTGALFGETVTWHAAGSTATTATALETGFINGNPYAFCGWYVDGIRWPDATHTSTNPASGIPMSRPRLAQGDYRPFWQDTDLNGLSDWWELRYFGSTNLGLQASDDLDGDGWSNEDEFLDNADPRNPASVPTPPVITFTPLTAFQINRAPWTVQAQITDNLSVESALLYWREAGDTLWQSNTLAWVSNTTYATLLTPASHGAKRVDYYLSAVDLLGSYLPGFCATTPVYSVIGSYATPWMQVTPGSFPIFVMSDTPTNAALTVANLAGPNLSWTVAVAAAITTFAATNSGWSHSGANDLWHVDTNRTWNGDAVWYCGDAITRRYPDGCHACLDTPAFRVGTGGGLLFRHWIKTEYYADTYFWDGAVVRISTNSGATFTLVTPTDGYPYQITPNTESPFPAEQPCLAGTGDGWQTLLLDLADYAGQDVIVRFEFGSDLYTVDEGWYIAGVTPVSCDAPLPPWLVPQGPWSGLLSATWSAAATFRVDPTGLAYNAEATACLRVTANDTTTSPLIPMTVRRGHFLSADAIGPGTVSTNRAFLFRNDRATLNLQAAMGAYLYCITSNGVPLQGVYNFATVSRSFVFSNLPYDLAIGAWFGYRTWNLAISTPYSTATPAAGNYTLSHGTAIDGSVVTPLAIATGTRRACSGWSLTGHTPATGATAQVSFILTNDATLTWNWRIDYQLTTIAGTNGYVTPTNSWYPNTSLATVLARPATYYHFFNWQGDTNGGSINSTNIVLPMIAPRTVSASFAPNLTPTHGVPEYWLAVHGWTNAFDTVAEQDTDGDGMTTWQEWVADTDPTNRLSVFELTTAAMVSNAWRITWIGGSFRTQQVEFANSLTGTWHSLFTNLPPTPITNNLTLPAVTNGFYRLRIP